MGPIRRSQRRTGLLLIAPALILYSAFVLIPAIANFWFSFTDWTGFVEPSFIGLDNYVRMAEDPRIHQALIRNVLWVIVGTVVPLSIGVVLAVILWQHPGPITSGLRVLYFIPFILPTVVVAVLWNWLYNPLQGWLNHIFSANVNWLGDSTTAFASVLVAAMWGVTGFIILIVGAALTTVDKDLTDAARVDGANGLQRLWHVIVPQISPVLITVATVLLIGGIGVFDIVFLLTSGGPGTATETLGIYTYRRSFLDFDAAYGAALAVFLTILALPLALYLHRRRLT
jgi:ABC-type sugar transport system permease subunit